MKNENNCGEKHKGKNKGKKINKSEKQKLSNNQNDQNINVEDPNFDINNYCPDVDAPEKKIRSHTVRESVKKGKLKKYIEAEKPNKMDQMQYLKTPQVRPLMRSLNPTPLRLNPFSCKSSKMNLINEEKIILSEHEEESENSEYSSSFDDSDSDSDIDIKKEEKEIDKANDKANEYMIRGTNTIKQKIIEEEEEKEGEKEEEKKSLENSIEVKEEDEVEEEIEEQVEEELEEEVEVKKGDNKVDNKDDNTKTPMGGILGTLINQSTKKADNKNYDEDLYEEEFSLKEMRKNMKEERRSFKKKNRDMFHLFDLNIRNSHQKFKKDVLNEKKSDDEDSSENENEIKNKEKCCPILDFYVKNTPIIKTKPEKN